MPDAPRDRELKACTFIKTVLMLSVLFYHAILFFSGTWFTADPAEISRPLTYLARWMNTFHIYGFALVSGYLFYYSRIECGKYPTYGGFLLTKVKRLLLPYLFVVTLWVIPFHWYFFRCSFSVIVDKYILGKSASQLWFLLMLFGVFLLFYPFARLFHRFPLAGAAFVLLAYVTSIRAPWGFLGYYGLRNALAYLPFFWLGFVLRQYKDARFTSLLLRIPAPIPPAVHIALFALREYLGTLSLGASFTPLLRLLQFAVTTGGALAAYLTLRRLALRVRWERPFFLQLARCSMPIYLFHQQLVYIAVTLLNGVMSPYLQVPIVVAFALGGAWGISLLFLKFRYTRPLVGEKM